MTNWTHQTITEYRYTGQQTIHTYKGNHRSLQSAQKYRPFKKAQMKKMELCKTTIKTI